MKQGLATRALNNPGEYSSKCMELFRRLGLNLRNNCHAAAVQLVIAGLASRVARGTHPSVAGQHSWAVIGPDPYAPWAVVDPTIAYHEPLSSLEAHPFVAVFGPGQSEHKPFGSGNIWNHEHGGRPPRPVDEVVGIETERLSGDARAFLEIVGPLDRQGWAALFSAPVEGWPSGEIVLAASRDRELSPLIPIDKLGMLTLADPDGLYLGARKKRTCSNCQFRFVPEDWNDDTETWCHICTQRGLYKAYRMRIGWNDSGIKTES